VEKPDQCKQQQKQHNFTILSICTMHARTQTSQRGHLWLYRLL